MDAGFQEPPKQLEIQALIFPHSFDVRKARDWTIAHGFRISKVRQVNSFLHIHHRPLLLFEEGSFKLVPLGDSVSAIVGRLRPRLPPVDLVLSKQAVAGKPKKPKRTKRAKRVPVPRVVPPPPPRSQAPEITISAQLLRGLKVMLKFSL